VDEVDMGYWKELPSRGEPEPPDKLPKSRKRTKTPREKRREYVISALLILFFLAILFLLIYFDPNHSRDQNWKIALIIFAIFLLMIGMGAGINAINKRLRGDKLDHSGHSGREKSDKIP